MWSGVCSQVCRLCIRLCRLELGDIGVWVSLLQPTFYRTALSDTGAIETSIRTAWKRLDDERRREYGAYFIDKCEWQARAYTSTDVYSGAFDEDYDQRLYRQPC
jgi:hypothetical protein